MKFRSISLRVTGAGKSTFLKIISGEIEPNKGSVDISTGERMAVLNQNQFAFDDQSVLNTVLMGHKKMWEVMHKRDSLYAKADFSEADGILAGELEHEFGEMGGYTAESDAATLLSELGVSDELHVLLMKDIILISCFWMSLPITWMWKPSAGSKISWLIIKILF
jgi:ATPase subunit of ABC transporter with duplicated ATPase domains